MVWHQAAVRAEHINKSGDRKMFCKYCGSRTDSNDSVCERCLQPVNSENGNGFWDMAADPRAYSQTNKQVIEKVVVKEVKKPMLLPIVISTAICVFCLILLALNVATSKKTTKLSRTVINNVLFNLFSNNTFLSRSRTCFGLC